MKLSYCFRPLYYMPLYLPLDGINSKIIRMSIFLITGMCVGFLALLWALHVLQQHHKSGGKISTFTIFLLISDILELIWSPAFLVCIIKNNDLACIFFILLFGARLCGHLSHQLVALENILTKEYPSLAVIFSPCYALPCGIAMGLVVVCFQLIPCTIIKIINIFLCAIPVIVFGVTCILTCKGSSDANRSTDRKPGMLVISVAMFTLIILYMPFFLTCFLELPLTLDFLVSLRLLSEPLLCVLICRKNQY